MDRVSTARGWLVACLVALGMFILPLTARAEVKPGDYITVDNASKVKDLVSPGVYWRVRNGMTMKIVPTERIDWPPPYKDATEKYSTQVRLTPDHRSLLGYVAGEPFPIIDANDPDAGTRFVPRAVANIQPWFVAATPDGTGADAQPVTRASACPAGP